MQPLVQTKHFTDAQAHAEAMNGWQHRYYQISAGQLESSLAEVLVPGLQVIREKFTRNVAQYGVSPEGTISFALPLSSAGAGVAKATERNTKKAAQNAVYGITSRWDYILHVAQGSGILAVVIDEQEWRAIVETTEPHLSGRKYQGDPVHMDRKQFSQAVYQLTQLLEMVLQRPQILQEPGAQKLFKHSMLDTLLNLYNGVNGEPEFNFTQSVRSELVRRSRDIALASDTEAVTVLDLCMKFRVSRRTLQTSFVDVTGITPSSYLRAIRLNEVRSLLLRTPQEVLTIGDAAARFNFYHLSHFAADYRQLFGELPSQTKRAGVAPSGSTPPL